MEVLEAKVRLVLDVNYDLQGETGEDMANTLRRLCERAIGNGMLTGDTAALVDQYSMEAVVVAKDATDDAPPSRQATPEDLRLIALRSDDNGIRDTLVAYPQHMTKEQANALVTQAVGDAKRLFPVEHTFEDLVEALESYDLKVVQIPDAAARW